MTLNTIYECVKNLLNFTKIWFKILSQTDTGREFIQGISEQVQMIYNNAFKNESITPLKMDDAAKQGIKLLNMFKVNPNRAEKILNAMLSFSDDKIKGLRLKANEKAFVNGFRKWARKFVKHQNEIASKSMDGWLAKLLEGANKFEKDFMDNKTKQVFIESGFRIIKMVYLNTRIRVDTLQPGWDIKKKISVVSAIKGLRMLKDSQTINVAFTYNNNTQYGDNDTYNQWINNVNILSTNGNFRGINWDALEKNAILIDAKFKEHKYKQPTYLSDYE